MSRLHAQGIVHRDLKLSNILLNTEGDQPRLVVNDFSSAVSEEALRRGLYGDQGPTQQELSLQYAPPEVRLSSDSHFSFDLEVPESYDIWSVGIIFLEILLGTGDVFEVEDQRTAAIIRHRLYSSRQRVDTSPDGNQDKLLSDALFLASLSEFCIFQSYSNFKDESSTTSDLNPNEPNNVDSDFTIIKYSDSNTDLIETSEFKVDNRLTKSLQSKSAMACKAVESSSIMSVSQPHLHSFTENNKSLQVTSPRLCESFETIRKHIQPLLQSPRCGQETLRRLLLKKDSLGVGFDDRWGLDLLTRLLQFEPNLRMPLSEALLHAYFVGPYRSSVDDSEHATAAERDIYDERNNVSVGGTAASSPAILATARRRVPASSATTSTASSTIINCTIDDDNRICGSTEMESSFAGNVETDEVDYVSLWLELDNLEAVANNDSTTDESDLFSLDTKFIAEPEESNAFPLWELLNVSYFCPRCHRHFSSYESCITHARARRHGSRCQFTYNSSFLPSCTTEHSLTPADPHSGWCDLQGRRGYLEDRHGLDIRENYSFYGVYDGHFGSRTARFTARHLPTSFYEAITKPGADVEFDLSSVNSSFLALNAQNFHILDHINNQSRQHWASTIQLSDDEDIVTNIDDKLVTVKEIRSSMRSAYLQTDSLFLQVISGTKEISGTTATTIALFPNHIVVGNVGDSRAVLCCNVDGGPILLTEDHTASSAREVTRVLSRGGWFSAPSPGSHSPSRVNDRLAVTRSLGDFAMKPDIVIADPDVIVISRTQPTLESKENGLLSTHNRINNNLHSERPLPEPNSCILYKELLQSLSNERHSSGEDNSQNSSISSQLFVIIASDGVWDEVSLSDSVDIVCEQLHADLLLYRSTMNISTSILHASDEKSLSLTWTSMHSANLFHRAAKRLTEEALLRGSSDNIGTCVIDLVSF